MANTTNASMNDAKEQTVSNTADDAVVTQGGINAAMDVPESDSSAVAHQKVGPPPSLYILRVRIS